MPKAKKVKERGFTNYFPKIAKKIGVSTKSEVNTELNELTLFALKRIIDTTKSIVSNYQKKEGTVKVKVVRAALNALLTGDIKKKCLDAAEEVEVARATKAAEAKSKKKEKSSINEAVVAD
jgi:preprotein translocase subunit SecF